MKLGSLVKELAASAEVMEIAEFRIDEVKMEHEANAARGHEVARGTKIRAAFL
jgi:hypothetical protein